MRIKFYIFPPHLKENKAQKYYYHYAHTPISILLTEWLALMFGTVHCISDLPSTAHTLSNCPIMLIIQQCLY